MYVFARLSKNICYAFCKTDNWDDVCLNSLPSSCKVSSPVTLNDSPCFVQKEMLKFIFWKKTFGF